MKTINTLKILFLSMMSVSMLSACSQFSSSSLKGSGATSLSDQKIGVLATNSVLINPIYTTPAAPGQPCRTGPINFDNPLPPCPVPPTTTTTIAPTPTTTPVVGPSPTPAPPTTNPVVTPTPISEQIPTAIPTQNLCSNYRTQWAGSNVKAATTLEVDMIDPSSHQIVCRFSNNVRENLMNTKLLSFIPCAGLLKDSYIIELIDPVNQSKNLIFDKTLPMQAVDFLYIDRSVHASDNWNFESLHATTLQNLGSVSNGLAAADATTPIYILYDVNTLIKAVVNGVTENGLDDKLCDHRASPLFVDTGANDSLTTGFLSAPLSGIFFNILGQNSFPAANTPKQISWIRNPRYMFVVLPDTDGKVNGIDQMFGDNTVGPDDKFASNGFAALAKWDANKDGRIDKDDAVYGKLRLWSNRRMDSVVHPDELYTLEEMGIQEIDLNYDPNFTEQDAYGNRIELKSVVKFTDGKMRLIFDLWFRYL